MERVKALDWGAASSLNRLAKLDFCGMGQTAVEEKV